MRRNVAVAIYLLVLLLWNAGVGNGGVFTYRLMRNAGLVSTNASSMSDCISKCTGGCSAVSFQFSSGKCLKSMCNQLDLVENKGWNTQVLSKFSFPIFFRKLWNFPSEIHCVCV